jgi:hypothetical protein
MSARPGLCGGRQATGVPTAINSNRKRWRKITGVASHRMTVKVSVLLVFVLLRIPFLGQSPASDSRPQIVHLRGTTVGLTGILSSLEPRLRFTANK